jgi:AbrB family looped-hinge helix DNA binding protein
MLTNLKVNHMKVKVSPKGQITIPKSVREIYNIQPGDSIIFVLREETLVLQPVTETLFDLRGSVPVTERQDFDAVLEEAKRLVAEEVAGVKSGE